MKIAYCNDLHLEFKPLPTSYFEPADLLILSGDILPINQWKQYINTAKFEPNYISELLDHWSYNYKHIVYVLGNHEFYHGNINQIDELKQLLKPFNITILDNEAITIDNIRIFGGTCWTDLNNNDPITKNLAVRYMSDFRLIDNGNKPFTPDVWYNLHQQFIEQFDQNLDNGYDIVISHHAPMYGVIHPNYKDQSNTNHLYCSNLSKLIEKSNAKYWFYGHLHGSVDMSVYDCHLLTSARGYPGELLTFADFKVKYLEV
jgi:Icc-related predicted phosphoesterase